MVKILPANEGDSGDVGSILGSGRYPGGGHGNSLQYFCLENPLDREAWWATVYGVTKSQTRLKLLSMHEHVHSNFDSKFWCSICIKSLPFERKLMHK